MTRVRLHRLALREFHHARRRYAKQSLIVANRFCETIETAIKKIEEQPTLPPADDNNVRWVKSGRFPYLLFYEYFPMGVALVMAIAHKSRRPGYWMKRKSKK